MRWKVILGCLVLGAACLLAMAATKPYYAQYDGLEPGASAAELWIPTYNGVAFRPTEIDIIVNGATNAQYLTLTVYIPASSGPTSATDSFTVKPTASATGTVMLEYVGPMSDTLRVVTPANFAGSAHAFK
jgi:hypothetical protein